MRNVRIDDIDHVTRAVIAIGTDYPPGHLPHAPASHGNEG